MGDRDATEPTNATVAVPGSDAATLPGPPIGASGAGARPGAAYGRFVVERALGGGGMGVVLLARDPELGRRVALKLLRPDHAIRDGRDRLIREAQAMAKLAHPNVVTVYDVGKSGDQVFIAMELVDGDTLRAWMRTDHPWREAVAMFVAIGRGLAHAHDAGLVHRDVKPENVLIGRDGRPRVTDFGLVSTGVAPDTGAIAGAAILSGLTIAGSAVGTPAYMSPEQWAGGEIDARSDQFSLCIALWEAIYGARPFAGTSGAELAAAVRAGVVVMPPADRKAPAWLAAALRRGLSIDPGARWPTLSALLDELSARSGGGRRAIAIAGGAAAVVSIGAVAAVLLVRGGEPDACATPAARVAAVWSPARRAALEDHLVAIDPSLGAKRFALASSTLDRGTVDWGKEHVAACRATHVEHRQSDGLLDERMRCLDHWLGDASRGIGALETAADRAALDDAIGGIARLAPPGACADVTATPPPATPEGRAEAKAIGDELEALRVAKSTGVLGADGPARVAAVVARARALDHPPTLAAVMQRTAEILRDVTAADAAMLDELTRVAAIAGDDRAAAYAWVTLVKVRGADLDHPEQAEALYASAEAALLRAKDPPDLRFELLLARAGILRDTGRVAEALPLLDRAAQVIAAADPARLPSTLLDFDGRLAFTRALAFDAMGRREDAAAAYQDAIAKRTEMLGADHPDIGKALIGLGETYRALDRIDDAMAAYQEAARMLEARLGDSTLLAMALDRVASAHVVKGEPEAALPIIRRAVAIADKVLPADNPKRWSMHGTLAIVLTDVHDLDGAIAEYNRAVEADAAAKRKTNNAALTLYQRGDALEELQRFDECIADYRRAIAILDELGTGTWYLRAMLTALGRALVDAGRAKEAVPVLERAHGLTTDDADPFQTAELRFHRGRAAYASGRDRRGGLTEARAGRQDAATRGEATPGELAVFDAWLAKHPR